MTTMTWMIIAIALGVGGLITLGLAFIWDNATSLIVAVTLLVNGIIFGIAAYDTYTAGMQTTMILSIVAIVLGVACLATFALSFFMDSFGALMIAVALLIGCAVFGVSALGHQDSISETTTLLSDSKSSVHS